VGDKGKLWGGMNWFQVSLVGYRDQDWMEGSGLGQDTNLEEFWYILFFDCSLLSLDFQHSFIEVGITSLPSSGPRLVSQAKIGLDQTSPRWPFEIEHHREDFLAIRSTW
jgi:hypothetical protein